MEHKNSLAIPEPVLRNQDAVEIGRIWADQRGQYFRLQPHVWPDPAGWGVMIADLIRHLAHAYAEDSQYSEAETFERIRNGLVAELESPTDSE